MNLHLVDNCPPASRLIKFHLLIHEYIKLYECWFFKYKNQENCLLSSCSALNFTSLSAHQLEQNANQFD